MNSGNEPESGLLAGHWNNVSGTTDGPLRIGGIEASDLVEQYGSPLYVYSAEVLRRNLARVREAVGDRVGVLYALKANPNIGVAAVLRQAGAGAEVASAGEIHAAVAAGYRGEQLQFAGPGKTERDFVLGLQQGLGSFNLESEAEYEALAAVGRRLGVRPRVAVRVNPRVAVSGARMRMSGGGKKFGVDADEVAALLERMASADAVEIVGLHTYAGTQNFDAEGWVANATALRDLAAELEAGTGVTIGSLNFGGGFGVAYYENDPEFDLAAAGAGLQELVRSDARPDRSYHIELGRYLAATAGVYLARVSYLKESGGSHHVIIDGGMHHHSAAAGLGSIMRRSYPIANCAGLAGPGREKCTVGGPLCTPADEFAADLDLPNVSEGDVIAVFVSGAYGLTFSNLLFLSHPTPAEILVDDGASHVVRAAGDERDVLRGQAVPDHLKGTSR